MDIRPLTEMFGAEITGIDLSSDPSGHALMLREALLRSSVLVVRDQRLSESQLVALSRGFGPLEPYDSTVKEFLMPDFPEVIVLSNILEDGRPIGIRDAGQYWHTDRSYVERPAWCSLLHAKRLPIDDNGVTRGNTEFASTAAALAALPEALRARLRALQAVHRYVYRYTSTPDKRLPDAVHPVVLPHPYTGQESLYVNSGFTCEIIGMPEIDGAKLLKDLFAHICSPQFVYRHEWQYGDLVVWDNFATQHRAVSDYELPLERLMWRTTVSSLGRSEM